MSWITEKELVITGWQKVWFCVTVRTAHFHQNDTSRRRVNAHFWRRH